MWTPEKIESLLKNNPRAVERAILALYERQTSDEQVSQDTKHHNKRGFSAAHARKLSFVAEFLKKGGHLKTATCEKYLETVLKYRRQLAEIANEKGSEKQQSN